MRYGWSLRPLDWAAVTDELGAALWRNVPFRQVQRQRIPEEAGIYMLGSTPRATGLPARLYNALYIGQATNLRTRFLQHLRHPSPDVGRAGTCFDDIDFWFIEVDSSSLNRVESMLIECLGPSANRRAGIAARIGPPVVAGGAPPVEETR
jgi:hypothetical protein